MILQWTPLNFHNIMIKGISGAILTFREDLLYYIKLSTGLHGYGIIMMIGIVPITCEELFKGIEAKKGTEAEYQVVLNMLEIYNEQVGR